uniref:Fe2OG dioxygenase domain-containing protein n=1 Tax=Chromera velia CCMP2878 TaxID=1169474 RepID=A0A0G4FW87_9ALVE|eukprot:Cvel_475.t1-p1 / transcript=Cvel_475.t1 / gene=Cvel_475 / organism=Chromera_velia_CCMP2878 / gene_product=hypothetical protein / transcript_product=hypothetical protein / location=Cvel_scaffold15:53155-59300(-) / protein_length=717 / sequence_SO=supercontig / SO=protein_coding / is_pseudo=false
MPSATERLTGDLTDALDNMDSKFMEKGEFSLPPETGLQVTLSEHLGGETVKFPLSLESAENDLKPILEHAETSPFGRGGETVVDSSVRVASHLTPEMFSVSFDPKENAILDTIRQALVPDMPEGGVRAELQKLNIYSKGGHFKAHKDTPRGTSCFGTLVVFLPLPFKGGALTLTHDNKKVEVNPSLQLNARPKWSRYHAPSAEEKAAFENEKKKFVPTPTAHWAAFFADVEHEVLPVTAGTRLTLTYILHRDAQPDPHCDVLLARATNVFRVLKKALKDPNFMKEGGKLGWECKHLYEESQLAETEKKLLQGAKAGKGKGASSSSSSSSTVSVSSLKLKNEDATVAVLFHAAGLTPKVLRILSDYEGYVEEKYVMDKMPKASDQKKFGGKQRVDGGYWAWCVTPEDIDDFCDGTADSGEEGAKENRSRNKKQKEKVVKKNSKEGGKEEVKPRSRRAAAAKASAAIKASRLQEQERVRGSDSESEGEEEEDEEKNAYSEGEEESDNDRRGESENEEEDEDDDSDEDMAPGCSRGHVAAKSRPLGAAGPRPPLVSRAAPKAAPVNGLSALMNSQPKAAPKPKRKPAPASELNKTRVIKVKGGQGKYAAGMGGQAEITLNPGEGLMQLKKKIKQEFGHVPRHRVGELKLMTEDGSRTTGETATSKDLVNGLFVQCTYEFAPGNPECLPGLVGRNSYRGRYGRGFGGFGYGRGPPSPCLLM